MGKVQCSLQHSEKSKEIEVQFAPGLHAQQITEFISKTLRWRPFGGRSSSGPLVHREFFKVWPDRSEQRSISITCRHGVLPSQCHGRYDTRIRRLETCAAYKSRDDGSWCQVHSHTVPLYHGPNMPIYTQRYSEGALYTIHCTIPYTHPNPNVRPPSHLDA